MRYNSVFSTPVASARVRQLSAILIAFTIALSLLGWVGCDATRTNAVEANTAGSFDVRLTDALGDVLQSVVTIKRVSLVPVADSSEEDVREEGTSRSPRKRYPPTLRQLDTADVPYETTRGDSATAELKQPSATETGIKINFDLAAIRDPTGESGVVLDFSVRGSFGKAGKSSMYSYIFKPVVRARSVVVNSGSTGT